MAAPWLDEGEARLWRAYLELSGGLQRAMERQLERDAGLSGADYALLAPLSEAEGGVLRMRELGRAVGWDRSRLSHQVRRMENRGLVERDECSEDARGLMVRLTEAGREAVEGAAGKHVETVRRYFFDLLAERDQATLTRVFEKLGARLAQDAKERP